MVIRAHVPHIHVTAAEKKDPNMQADAFSPEPPTRRLNRHRSGEPGIGSRFSADGFRLVGGLVALAVGLLVLGLIAAGAFIADPGHAGSIATGAFGVIGSIVGAYFGVKVGSDGTKAAIDGTKAAIDGTEKALEAHQNEAAKVQVFAAHLPKELADHVLKQAGFAPLPPNV